MRRRRPLPRSDRGPFRARFRRDGSARLSSARSRGSSGASPADSLGRFILTSTSPPARYSALVARGADPDSIGVLLSGVFVVGSILLWTLTYVFRVFTKKMTYGTQLKNYEDAVIQKRSAAAFDGTSSPCLGRPSRSRAPVPNVGLWARRQNAGPRERGPRRGRKPPRSPRQVRGAPGRRGRGAPDRNAKRARVTNPPLDERQSRAKEGGLGFFRR